MPVLGCTNFLLLVAGLHFGNWAAAETVGLDLLQSLKSDREIKGITKSQGSDGQADIWRFKSYAKVITLPRSEVTEFSNGLQSGALSGYFLTKQSKSSVGTLLHVSHRNSSELFFSLVSDIPQKRLILQYRILESTELHETVLEVPSINHRKWTNTLIIIDGDRLKLYVECETVLERELPGKIDLNFPKNVRIFFGQTPQGKERYTGWIQEAQIYSGVLDQPPWSCQPSPNEDQVGVQGQTTLTPQQELPEDDTQILFKDNIQELPQSDASDNTDSQRILVLEDTVVQLSNMVSMLKVQMAEMSSKVSYLEGCECTRQVCQFNGIEYQDKQSWQVDPCKQCVCQSGIVICQIYQDRPECVQPCISNPCPANTRCVGYPGYQNYTCLCADGQEGPNCEESNINVCTKPAEYGTCSKSEQKYYYNRYSQRCEEFVYSGCGGNTNNFESKRDCEEQCLIGACCHRTYIRTNPGLTFLAFTVLEPGFKCEIHSIHECKHLAEITGTTDKTQEVVSFHPGQGCKNGVCGLPSGCIFGSQIYKPGDTFRTNCQECTCQSNGNVQCRCDTVTMRKEIRDMTRSEIERFQSAVQKLQSSEHGNLWLELRNLYIRHVMHANGPMYLPWHRVFLRRVEQQLQEIDCDVTLPYFDFTMDVGNMSNALIWQANYFGGDGQGRCVPDLPFQDANQPWQPCLQRDLNPTVQLPSMVDFYVALSSNDFSEMSRCLQTYVSYFYEYVGGDMSSSGSTYDPLFFAVHSYIDMLYWRWQNKNGNTDNFPDFMKSIPMVPFNIRPEDTFNSEQQLCVSYTLPSFGDPCNDTAFVLDDEGFDPQGFNMQGFNRQGYDRFGYDFKGYDVRGQLDNRDMFSFDGYDEYGYNRVGYDRLGYNRHGYSQDGYNRDGFDIQGYDRAGFDRYGYNRQGYDRRGFDRSGYDIHQYLDTHGFYSVNGYNYYCLDRQGLNPAGFDRYGFNMEFHDEEYCSYSFNGPHITKTAYRVQEILYKQNKNFLMTIPRTCVELQPLPVSWYEQVWILNPKGVPVSVVREVTQYPDQSASQRFCFEVEKILDYCVCEETLVECPENPCENADCPAFPGATCFIDFCHECKAKWVSNDKEVDCTMPPDPCASNPCHNGGTCIAESIWPNEPDLFRCHCVPPYTGKLCEKEQFDLCMLPLDSGTRNCGRERVLWYFNMAAMECEQFVYSGCDGNANRFTSYGECQRSCITGACCWRSPTNPDDAIGYDTNGYDKYGYNIDGLNELGLDEATAQALNGDFVNFSDFDESGFDSNGCDRQGYDRLGYHCLTGFNMTGYNRIGEYDGITTYDRFGFDQDGYNRAGFDCNGINNEGRDYLGLNVGYVYECRVMSMMDCQAMEETVGNSREVLKFSLGKSCEDVQCGDICGCDFNGQTYRIGESFEYGCQQCSCTMSGSVQCACDGITQRREIRDLTGDEMKRYQNAIKSLHLHTGNPSIWDYFVNLHADSIPQAYGTESFLPWHRYFLRAVETELQKIDCGIFIPYFDWAIDAGDMDSSVAWQANYFGGDGEPDTDCVLHHPFKEHWPQTWGPCLRRNFNHNIQLPDAVNFQFIINEPSYEQFRVQLEAASGLFQLWVGGHMATPYSPYDPLFLSHFAFMDMIWDIWQQRNPDGVSRYPVPFRHIPMSPWQATPDEVLENQDQVCVVYIFPTEGVICNTTGKSVPSDQGRYVHHGYDSEGYDRDGYDVAGLDRYGMPDTRGIYNVDGYNKDGYRRNGFDDSGYDIYGFNTDHLNRDGFDVHSYDISGYDRYGFDKDGVTPFGFTREGSYLPGFEENEHFDSSGYNRYGLNKFGFDREGRDAFGFTAEGYDQYHCNYLYNGSYYLLYFHSVFTELLNATDEQLVNIDRICQPITPLPEWWLTKNWLTRNNQAQLIRLAEGSWTREHTISTTYTPRLTSVTDENLWLPITPDERFCFEIRHYCECPLWQLQVTCPVDLCLGEVCLGHPNALCRVNNCDRCTIEWYDVTTGKVVECQSSDCVDDNGDTHIIGSVWKKDLCTSCKCEVGQVISCDSVPCVDTLCTHPFKPENECCPICNDCWYFRRQIRNGDEFNPFDEPCESCACRNGNVICKGVECPDVECENPRIPVGECCPRCEGCEFQGRLLQSQESYKLDECTVCVCVRGTVQCRGPEDCPPLSCFDQYTPPGECCARCRNGCEYDDKMFANGDFFTPSTNPCLRCSCTMSIVRCNPVSCPEAPCENPIKPLGACCEVCSDTCLYEGEDYMTGDTWTTSDGCKECTCNLGDVDCVNIVECTTQCDHGAIRAGQCCSPCTDCTYNNQFIRNGVKFAANGDLCNQCVCQDGNIICQREECSPIDCVETETPDGSCCPVCKGCIDNSGRRYEHNDEWTPADDDCNVCRCREGRIDCERERCTLTCRHPIPEPDSCCPKCEGCLYQGQTYQNGDFVDDSNSCRNCICRNGNVECVDIECPQLGCPNPVFIPGSCCPICEDCLYEGQTFKNGETFTAPRQPCLECTCRNTQVNCRRVDQECSPDCMHPGRMADICCPVCDICEYERRNYRNGAVFRPDGGDICDLCTCVDGTVTCQTEVCPPLECRNPVQKPDKCCMECDVCIADGVEHAEGDVWDSVTDQCAVCTCTNTRVRCRNKDCPTPGCRHPAQLAHNCCPVCDNCLYDRRLFRNGQEFRDPLNPCSECICTDGNVQCERVDCPVLNCENQFTPEGECCPQCSETNCEHLGQSYRNRERFTNPSDSCEECMCIDGEVTCNRKPCPAVRCPNPRRGQCCDMCDGCTYNGVTYTTGETFSDPRERCKECTCQDGFVECSSITCDDVTCSHPITRPGDCCPVCEDCVYEGRRLGNGQTFSDPTDPCKTCTCELGSVVCVEISCSPVQCDNPSEDSCGCRICYDCLYNGQRYSNGDTFRNPDDDCQTCRCFNGNVDCVARTCPPVQCSDPGRDSCNCPVCQDCFYLNENYRDGETFMEPNDPCSRCQCVDGDVNCAPLPCPPVTCDNPVTKRGECCPSCPDVCLPVPNPDPCQDCTCVNGQWNCVDKDCPAVQCSHPVQRECCPECTDCLYDGKLFQNSEIFPDPNDACRTCRCLDGNVNCRRQRCEIANCGFPAIDQCGCQTCEACELLGDRYSDGETFDDPRQPCYVCQCLNGEVNCQQEICPPALCAEPVSELGGCCPICIQDSCVVNGVTYEEGDSWISPDDICEECLCLSGQITCDPIDCERRCSHPQSRPNECCPICEGCTYEGINYDDNEAFNPPSDPCNRCQCVSGNVLCMKVVCPRVDCPNPVTIPGQCCQTCQDCIHGGRSHLDGSQWTSTLDPCDDCICQGGEVKCVRKACPQVRCSRPILKPGECCQECPDTCEVDGRTYEEGDTWISPDDQCLQCLCLAGSIVCSPVVCPILDCSSPVSVPGQCCQECGGCVHNGQEYVDGSRWISISDPCEQCQCINGEAKCNRVRCPEVSCTHPAQTGCCPNCEACLYNNRQYMLGEVFDVNDCISCVCKDGNVKCVNQECPTLDCPYTTKDPGQCCERCRGCMVNGVEFADGESWVSDINPCLSCSCRNGVENCKEIRCAIPKSCAQVVTLPGQCCPLCQGCAYNGVTYKNGETFQPIGQPCETCTCESGNLNCYQMTCPPETSCPSSLLEPPSPGECCGKCQNSPKEINCTSESIGIKVRSYEDPCTVCECVDLSSWQCAREKCGTLSCPVAEQRKGRNDCCARCDRCYVEPDNKSYKDGETWVDPGNNCITCTCTGGVITCELEVCEPLSCKDGFEPYTLPNQCCKICRDTNVTCQLGDTVYQPNERWIKDDCTTCECKFGDVRCKTTTCRKIACQADETPTYTPGVCCPTCQPKPATCLAFGDPHYRTFDGKMIHFQGTCKYVMAMDCENQDYTVEVQNDDRGAFGAVSWTQEVTIKVSGLEIHLGQSGLVKVNGQAIVLPYLRDPFLYIEMRAGNNFLVNTDIGLNVHWDGSSRLEVSIPGTYSGRSCGLCGNFNSYPQDDLRMRSGEITTSVSKFGNSWKVFEPEQETCEDARDIDPCTEAGYRARKLANAKCAVLKSSRFSKCHRFIQPEAYFASCVYDMCACGSDDSCLCDVLSAYAAECRQSGVALNWRSTSLCAIQCPEERGLIFDECGPRCPRTCENKDVPLGVIEAQCFRPCVPGCQCRADKVLFDARCIDPDDCPEILYGNNVTLS